MASDKPQFNSDYTEFEENQVNSPSNVRRIRLVESIRPGLTVLTLAMGIVIVGTSGDSLRVYNGTHLSADYFLSLWPFDLDLGPTIALVTCGSIVIASSAISLVGSKIPALRNKTFINIILSAVAPFMGLIAALVAMSFFYAMNASDTTDTLLSWTCRWSPVVMTDDPHFGRLCMESQAALYLIVSLVPLELIVVGLAGWLHIVQKKPTDVVERKGSPAMS